MIYSDVSLVVLAAACAWAAEPLAARKCLVAVLVVVLIAGAPAREICAAAALVIGGGCLVRAAGNDGWYGFCGGVAGGVAVLLAPAASVAVAGGFLALFFSGWRRAPLGQTITWFAAGWFDVLGFVWAVEKLRGPKGHIFDVQAGTLSLLQIGVAFAFLLAGAVLWRLDSRKKPVRWRVRGGVGVVVAAVAASGWLVGRFGLSVASWAPPYVTAMGVVAAVYMVWRAVRGRWIWWYGAVWLVVGVVWPVGEVAALTVVAPVAASDVWRLARRGDGLRAKRPSAQPTDL